MSARYVKTGTAWAATPEFLKEHAYKPDMTWLISYPRTGSHWLRMMLELYTGRCLLHRTFFHPDGGEPLLMHEHDRTGDMKHDPKKVLFLYRNPVDTVFSLANYWMVPGIEQKESEALRYTEDYMIHLRKWLPVPEFVESITRIRYEELQRIKDGDVEPFLRVLAHFDWNLAVEGGEQRVLEVYRQVSKATVKNHTQEMEKSIFKNRVIAPEEDYEERRRKFHEAYADAIWAHVAKEPDIAKWFEELGPQKPDAS